MAKKGIRYAVFARLGNDGTYTEGVNISPVAGFNGNHTVSNNADYGDDVIQERDTTVTGGTLSVELNNDDDQIYTYLLGHSAATGSDTAIEFREGDEAPYVGVGAIGKSGSQWVAKWYAKVKFREPNDDNATRQESTTYNHVTIEGDIYIPDNGPWKLRETFATLAAAKTWLNTKAGITE